MNVQIPGPIDFFRSIAGQATPADKDWAPSSSSLPTGFDIGEYSQWVAFRDSQDFDKLVAESLSIHSDTVLGAVADIRRCLEAMRKSRSTYHDSDNRNARLKFFDNAPISIKRLWDARMNFFAGEKEIHSCKPQTSRIYIRGYISSILDSCLIDRRDQYVSISSNAIDLYYWLYLVSVETEERQHPDCEFSESVRKVLDLEKMWSKVVPQLFSDVDVQAFENRLIIALAPNPKPLMVADTAHVLYYMSPEIIGHIRPYVFKLFVYAVHTAFRNLLEGGQKSTEAHETIALTVLTLHGCRKRRGAQFIENLYQTSIPSNLSMFQSLAAKLVHPNVMIEVIIISAMTAFNMRNKGAGID
ncbi:hypothetical protein E1B28_007607 [Marasmius oreades]|uniref:Uncharacterized protein n=1 Tax=Marasmius oreades TaxID=181124 RepID=A0A9P7UTM4_9AGAR|nr:uncharacterized protein E1B28_007607 [Marasmius oreades]KAG7093977.1 hypothetical protein E1B28_007607 [Marasmius oreades]